MTTDDMKVFKTMSTIALSPERLNAMIDVALKEPQKKPAAMGSKVIAFPRRTILGGGLAGLSAAAMLMLAFNLPLNYDAATYTAAAQQEDMMDDVMVADVLIMETLGI